MSTNLAQFAQDIASGQFVLGIRVCGVGIG